MSNIFDGVSHIRLMRAVLKAIGMEGHPTERIVLELDIKGPTRVIVKGFVDVEKQQRLAGVFAEVIGVEDVTVNPDCTVVVTPHKEPS